MLRPDSASSVLPLLHEHVAVLDNEADLDIQPYEQSYWTTRRNASRGSSWIVSRETSLPSESNLFGSPGSKIAGASHVHSPELAPTAIPHPRKYSSPPSLHVLEESLDLSLLVRERSDASMKSVSDRTKTEDQTVRSESTIPGCAISMASTCIGSGLLALPFAFSQAGLWQGLALLAASGLLSFFVSQLLCQCCEWSGSTSFEEVAIAAYGNAGSVLMEILVVWLLIGAMSSLLVIIGDSLAVFLNVLIPGLVVTWKLRALSTCLDVALFILPLSRLQSPASLLYSNAVAVFSTVVVGCLLASRAAVTSGLQWPNILENHVSNASPALESSTPAALGLLRALPIILLSFGCQVQVPCIYADLKGRSITRMAAANSCAMGLCMILYISVGISGIIAAESSFTTGSQLVHSHINNNSANSNSIDNANIQHSLTNNEIPLANLAADPLARAAVVVPGNVLDIFPAGDSMALAMRGLITLAVTLVYPMLCLPCRSTIDHLLFGGGAFAQAPCRHKVETVIIIGATLFFATAVSDLSKVFGFTGATSGTFICYVLPQLFYLQIRRQKSFEVQEETKFQARACVVGLALMLPIMVLMTVSVCSA
eukprot:TRINITY_DN1716_c1_g3_i1.p1 TRINITY_DN1716_c1_g3~~TRINITY_DN1716_c1_g3_i1.p1  ORF type:complete len:598 (+),score=67.93 TRINITY_DN1716_c1_g3_i1:67-1860(+)